MPHLHTEIIINAEPEAVWTILAAFDTYPTWNPFIINIAGDQVPGAKLTAMIRPPGKSPMTFKPRLLTWTENVEFRWLGRFGIPGIFDGEHYFQLEPIDRGSTRFIHGENFSGLLASIIWKSMKTNTQAGFEAMNSALKKVVESGLFANPDVTN